MPRLNWEKKNVVVDAVDFKNMQIDIALFVYLNNIVWVHKV